MANTHPVHRALTAIFGKAKPMPHQQTTDVLPRRHEVRDRPAVQQTLNSINNERKQSR